MRRSVDSGKMKTMKDSAKTGQESRILKEAEVSIVSLSIAFSDHYKESMDLNTGNIHCTVYSPIFTDNMDHILNDIYIFQIVLYEKVQATSSMPP